MHHHRHGEPHDFARHLARLEGRERAAWQKPDRVVTALRLRRGQTACEIGAGSGYFALRIARAVGPRGHVFAVEADPRMAEVLRERISKARLANVTPVLALHGEPLLPASSCDLALMVNAFHHFDDGVRYLRRLARVLKPGGRLVNVDFHDGELPVGPPPELRLSRESFLAMARKAGFRLSREETFLPYQFFLTLTSR